MPVHDWTRVDAGIFHDFHTVWIGQIRTADRYINVPMERTYEAAYRGLPAFWRKILEE